jgi:hypothetical protein
VTTTSTSPKWCHQLCHDHRSRCRRKWAGECIDAEVESVQVHRMHVERRVDHAPMERVADGRGDSFRVRPRAAVYRIEDSRNSGGRVFQISIRRVDVGRVCGVHSLHAHQHAIARRSHAGRVDHQRAAEEPGELPCFARPGWRRSPVHIVARNGRGRREQPNPARRDDDRVHRAEPIGPAADRRRYKKGERETKRIPN